MNKKKIARLLFQRKDIRALFESRRFDTSTLKRIVSEEIMRESEEGGFTDLETVQARENAAEMKELQVSLNLAQDNLKAFQSDYLKAKERFTQAKVDGDKAAQSSERGEMAQAKTFKREEQERIDKIEAQIAYLKSLGVTASKTQTPDDDEYVDMAVDAVAQNIKDATDMIDAAENEAELAGISRDVATSNSGELETAQKAVQAAVAKDKEQSSSAPPSEMLEPLEQEETEETYDIQVNQKVEFLLDHPEVLEGIITGLKSDTPSKDIERFLQADALIKMYDETEHVEKILKAIEEKSKTASPEPPAEETPPQPPVSPGWKNAKSAARAKVTEDTTIEQIKASLESADAFKAFWGVKGEVDTKMEQAKALFDDKYFAARIEELKAKATDEGKKEEVAEKAANLAATVMGYSEFLNNMMSQQPDFKPPEMDFPQAIPEDEKEFNRSFIQPLVKIQEPSDASVDKDGLKEDQYIELFTTNAAKNDGLKLITEKDLQVFGGWYIMSKQSKSLNEAKEDQLVQIENYGNFNDFWNTTNGPKFVNDEIKKSIKQRFRKKDPKLEATLAGIQTLIDSGKISIPDSITIGEDPNKEQVRLVTKEMVQDVIQNTPEVEPDADADLSPLATEEMDAAWTTTLNAFFGKDPTRSSFMRQLLLKHQASMLYGMIGVLEQIITGGAGDEERSLSNEKTQVKRKEEPVVPPAEADKKEAPPKTDTTSTDTSVDDEEGEGKVQSESLEEQVINEIFGLFGGKDKEDEEIEFSPKSTSLMRQDLEAMVDLLRSLKADIGQYKDYSTSSSANPRYNGSTLKTAMDAKLKVVQQSIAHLAKVIDVEVQSQKDQLKADGAQAGQDSNDLNENSDSDRKVRIAEVEKVYNEMRRQYLKGLQVSLSTNDAEEAKAGAKELKDYVMGQETFMSYFPSNIITSSGGVMTLGAAHESMVAIIAPFIETIRDIVTITKTQKVSESNLQQAIGNLVMISNAIESMFKVPSLIDREFMKKYIEAAKQNPENQPLTDEEPSQDDEQSQVKPPGDDITDFLKEKLGDSLNTLGEKFLNMFATEIEQDGATLEDQEEKVDDVVEDIAADIPWIQKYSSPTQGMAIAQFSKNLMDIAMQKQIFNEEVEIPTKFKDQMRAIAGTVDLLDDATIEVDMVDAIEMIEEEDRQQAILKIMEEDPDGLSTHVSLMYKLGPDLGEEFVKELIADPVGGIPKPESLPDSEGDDELASGDTIDKTLKAADDLKNRSGLEDESEAEAEEEGEIDDVEMAIKLGYKDGSEFASNFNSDVKKIIDQIGLEFRVDTEDDSTKKKAYDFAADSLMTIAMSIVSSKDINEGFIQKTLSRLKSRSKEKEARKITGRKVKTAQKIVSEYFPESLEDPEEKLPTRILGWLDQFKEAPKKQMSLMKALSDNDVNIPATLRSLGTGGGDSSPKTSSDPMDYMGPDRLAEALRPIIEKMLNEHYNH